MQIKEKFFSNDSGAFKVFSGGSSCGLPGCDCSDMW